MIVRGLRVHPFGFFPDRQIAFQPGLNVVLGPNEAGKSTIFAAIKSSLLRSQLNRRELTRFIGRWLPAGGGDIARLELAFTTAEGSWVLRRQWGAAAASQLSLPSGGTVVDDEGISRKLQEALPVRQGTFWKVLMTGQAELAETIESLRGDSAGAVSDLTDMLRRTVLETGGIPVSAFRALLAARVRGAFQRWDGRTNGPEKGRGIQNPWKNDLGQIVETWYSRERLRARRSEALAFEESLDETNRRLRDVVVSSAAAETFLSSNRKAAQDAVERRRLEAERSAVRLELEKLHRASRDWPAAAAREQEVRRAMSALEAARAPLDEEGRAARAAEAGRAVREKHARVTRLLAWVDEERGRARAARPVERKDLEEIRRRAAEAAALRAGLEACAIDVVITGKASVDLSIQEDLRPESRKRLGAGETARVRAAGRLRIDHPDMVIEIRSADPGALSAAEKEAAARKALEEALARCGARSVEEAEERARSAEEAAAAVRAAEKALAEELAGQSAADIAARAAALGTEAPTRPWADISAELARMAAERDARVRELQDLETRLQEWRAGWGSPEALLSLLADALARERDSTRRIDASAPLPAGFPDPQSFLSAYEKARDDAKSLAEERARLSDRKRELEVRAPGETAEELTGPLRDAEAAFETALRRGRALERISRTADALLLESDSAVFRGMQAEMDPLIRAMSLGRHARVDMEGTLPRGLADGQGRALPWELLSGGTRDTLALAVRLAMASFFLRDTDGFMMLDDPLVEMDPERQAAAARALASFAAKRQLIVFTCHPASAELLGGTLIRL